MSPFCHTPECYNPIENKDTGLCSSCNRSQRKEAQLLTREPKERKPIRKYGLGQAKITKKLWHTYDAMDKKAGTKRFTCQATGEFSSYIDHDHTISQKRCKQIGKPELIWDERNIVYSSRTAHMEWESYKDGMFAKHKNFHERMAFLKEHDIEGWEKRMMALERLEEIKNQII